MIHENISHKYNTQANNTLQLQTPSNNLCSGVNNSNVIDANGSPFTKNDYSSINIINSIQYIKDCITYEGGFSCSPFGEAHGGYSFCALASFIMLSQIGDKSYERINYDRLAEWLSNRQFTEFGGFNGRVNKLVDSCYSFWVGACFELIDILS